jgi:hypothetical protein
MKEIKEKKEKCKLLLRGIFKKQIDEKSQKI